MARRIGEPVMVRAQPGGAPGTFLWRDRVYIVREVLGHWQERRSWWVAGAARAVHGDAETGGEVSSDALDDEREIWRVEATAGRMFGNGVYDLARDGAVAVAPSGQGWHLLRVAD
jgi:Family of unknown function (DUF6504)